MNVSKRLLCLLSIGLISSTAIDEYLSANTTELYNVTDQQQATQKVQGIVTDKSGEPLIGVSVAIMGTSTGTITDIDGKYEITLTENKPSLTFTYIGYVTQTIPVTKNSLDVVLAEDAVTLDELVVVGYGVQKKENLTGAVTSVDVSKTMDSRPISDVGRALQGAVPGLTITSSTGEIGSSPNIKIRGGVGSPNGKSDPLILVDNVVIPDLNLVNPDDIESISVLKDAASTSIYGARAAFGVILITTKSKNKNNQFRVSYSNNFAWRKPTVKAEQLPGWQQAEINLAGEERMGNHQYEVVGGIIVNQNVVDKMHAWADQYGSGKGLGSEMEYGRDFEFNNGQYNFYRTWDWYDMFYKNWTPQQTHNLSINGGNEKTNYNIALGYLYQDGVSKISTDSYDRYNASMSINTQAYSWLSIRASVMYTRTNREKPFVFNSANSELYDYMYYLYRWQPMYPYGTYEGNPFRSAITEMQQASMNKTERDYWRIGGGATVNVTKELTIDADFIYTTTDDRKKQHGGPVFGYDFWGKKNLDQLKNSYGNYMSSALDYVQQNTEHTELYTTNAYATYTKKIGEHSFKGMLGTNIESSSKSLFSANRRGLIDPNFPELSLATGTSAVTGSRKHWAVAGFFSRINYSYKDRYLLEINGRYDGSSSFPKGDKWGFFPSFSAGYRMSEEDFMKSLYPIVSSLKFRGSYGVIGNQEVGDNNFYISLLSQNVNYPWYIDGLPTVTMKNPTVVKKSLTWEKVKTIDFGFDARFLNDKLGITFDWYKRTTTDILSAGESLPSAFGSKAPYQNYGELETPGWELAIDYNFQFSNGLRITLGGQITDYYTKVKKWSKDVNNIPTYGDGGRNWYSVNNYREGMVLGDIWGYKVDRLFQESDFDANGNLKSGIPTQELTNGTYKLQPGDVKYKDLDGDDKITQGKGTTDDHGDKTVIGNIFPRYQYGFTIAADFKGFDLNIFFQGVGQRKIWAGGNMVLPGYTSGEPYFKGAEDYWTPENTGAFYPRPTVYNQKMAFNYEVNDRYLLNMAYLRCKTLTLGYTLPHALTQKAYINNLRVYVTAENLFDFNKLKGLPVDPETGITVGKNSTETEQSDPRNFGRSYPYQRTLSFGIQLTL